MDKLKNSHWIFAIISFILILSFQLIAALYGLLWVNAIGFCAYLIFPFLLTEKEKWKEIGFSNLQHWSYAVIGVAVCGILIVLYYFMFALLIGNTTGNFFTVLSLNHIITFNIQAQSVWSTFPVSALTLGLFSPLTEELYFRGLLLNSLEQRFGFKSANTIQALCFGLIHIAYCWIVAVDITVVWSVVPTIALIGFVYGIVKKKTNSVVPAIVVHAITNVLITVILYVLQIPLLL